MGIFASDRVYYLLIDWSVGKRYAIIDEVKDIFCSF